MRMFIVFVLRVVLCYCVDLFILLLCLYCYLVTLGIYIFKIT